MWTDRLLTRRYFAYACLFLFFVALITGVLSDKAINGQFMNNPNGEPDEKQVSQVPQGGQNFPTLKDLRENWPGFRGPDGVGHVYNNEKFPREWNGVSGKNILWKTPIPLEGYNSPIIWEGKLFFSGADDVQLSVFCLDVDDGQVLWEHPLNDVAGSPDPRPKVMDYTGYAAPTMAVDGRYVYVLFGTGDVACIDFSGKRIWAKNLGPIDNHYGHSSSLMVHENNLLIQYDQNTGGRLIGLNVETGAQVYNLKRDTKISWASPILIENENRKELILNANPFVISYDPGTGKELWRLECMSGEVGPSPAFADGVIYVCNDYAKLAAFKPGLNPELLWETDEDLSEVASPVANADIVIMAASFGTVSCFDSKTGEKLWYYDPEDGFYSSPLLVGNYIYLMDVEGTMHIIKAERTFELVHTNLLGEKASTIPAFYEGKIFIRGEGNLFCIGQHE